MRWHKFNGTFSHLNLQKQEECSRLIFSNFSPCPGIYAYTLLVTTDPSFLKKLLLALIEAVDHTINKRASETAHKKAPVAKLRHDQKIQNNIRCW